MAEHRVLDKIHLEMGPEDVFFKEQDQELIKELRERAAEEADAKYCEEHKNHCFRCGTNSLVEVHRGDVTLDICVNDNCGAVHLDQGELEQILKDEKAIFVITKSVLSIFKK